MPESEKNITVFLATSIKDRCFIHDCDEPATAACAYSSTAEADVVIVWLCEEHGEQFILPDGASKTDVLVQEISRTCRAIPRGVPCGAYATEVVVVGYQYDDGRQPEVRLVSSCARHAAPHTRETWIK